MTNDSTTTLDAFSNATTEDNPNPSPKTVIELFDDLDQWRTAVRINNRDESFLVGRITETSPKTYELYYEPTSTAGEGIAGTISYHRFFSEDEDNYVSFEPATNDNETDEEATAQEIRVQALTVSEHDRSEQLDAVLPLIRDSLMDTDWVIDPADVDDLDLSRGMFLVSPDDVDSPEDEPWLPIRGDAGYGEWQSAMLTLADFFDEEYDDAPFALSTQSILATKVMHGVARYPLNATKLVSHIDDVVADAGENPEAFRTLLLDYAVKNISLDTVDTPLTEVSVDE